MNSLSLEDLDLDDLDVEPVGLGDADVTLETLTTGQGMTEIGASCAICGSCSCCCG